MVVPTESIPEPEIIEFTIFYTILSELKKQEEREKELKQKNTSFLLYFSVLTTNLLIFTCGCSFAWTSPVIPKLKQLETSPLPYIISPTQESWIAATLPLGSVFGPLMAGQCVDRIGRKKTLTLLAVPILIGYAVLAVANTVELYYLARFIMGLGIGSVFGLLPMYIGEISEDHNRGKFCCISGVFATSGLLFPSLIGPLLSIKYFNISCCVGLVIFVIVFPTFMPDSPIYLCSINDKEGAEKALMRLRNKDSKGVQKELQEMLQNAEREKDNKGGFGDLFHKKASRKGFIVTAGLVIVQQLSGINAIFAFMQTIFEATGSSIPAEVAALVVGIIQVIVAVLTSYVVDKLGRKTLLLASAVGCGSSIILLGLYFFLKEHKFDVSSIFWLPILCIIVYIVTFNLGLGPLPWTVMSEVFPASVRSVASALTSFTCFVACFSVTLVFPILSEYIGITETFWLFGACCIAGIAFIGFVLPETKGKTLMQIQEALGG